MPEISQADFDLLRGAKGLLDTIYDDPDHGMAVKQAVRKHRPGVAIPALDAQDAIKPFAEKFDAVGAAVAKLNERLDNEKLERDQATAADALARQMARARDTFRLTDEGVEGMTTLMREKGIVDPVDAAQLYVARQPKPSLTSQRQGRYGSATYADVTGLASQEEKNKLLIENPDRFLAQEIEECLAEFALDDAA